MNLSRSSLEALGVKYSKNGYIIASKKNWERLSKLPFASVSGTKFDGMVDGHSSHGYTMDEARKTAENIIANGRFGRGIAVYGADERTNDRACVSVGDCCYDVNFYL